MYEVVNAPPPRSTWVGSGLPKVATAELVPQLTEVLGVFKGDDVVSVPLAPSRVVAGLDSCPRLALNVNGDVAFGADRVEAAPLPAPA